MRIKNLVEAEVKPGERKKISLKIAKLEKLLKKIDSYQETASTLHGKDVPDSVAAEYAKVQQGIYDEIEKLSLEKDQFKSEKNNLPTKFYNLMQGIAKNCTEIVSAYTELNPDFKANNAKVFYRGIKSSEDALYGKPFDERRVMTSSSKLSDIFNNAMKAAGFEARRDNTSFVSSDKGQASGYGTLYVMFPKDGFSFAWSRNTKDLILDRGSYSKMIDYEKAIPLKDVIIQNKDKLNSYEYDFSFSDLLGDYNLDNTLRAAKLAIDNGIIPPEFEPLTHLENIITPESLVKGFELDKDDLLGAIQSEKEVYIRGAYYAVRESYLKDIMKFLELQVYPEGKPKKVTPGEYEIGDRVTIKNKNSNYFGQSGEVQYVYTNYGEISVLLDGNNWTNDFKFKEVKHESGDDSPDYEEGGWIEVIDENSEDFGKKGKISFVYDTGKLEVFLNGGKYKDFMPNQVKSIEAPGASSSDESTSNLKIGDVKLKDKVKIIGSHPNAGSTGEVIYSYSTIPQVDVDIGTESLYGVDLKNIEKIETPEKVSSQPKFAEGDTVEITGPSAYNNSSYIGYTGTITSVSDDGKFVGVRVEDGTGDTILTYDVLDVSKSEPKEPDVDSPDFNKVNLDWEPEPEVAAPASEKLKAGDKVKVTGFHYGGHTGTVDDVLKTGMVQVTLDTTGTSKVFYANELTKVDTPKFEVGDTVEITKGSNAGKTGMIEYVSTTFNDASIKLPDGKMLYDVPLDTIEKIQEPAQAEPEQTASDIDIEDYTVGKTVKITKGEHAGKVGTIDYVSKVLANADILTPHGPMINNIPLADLQVLDFPVKNTEPAANMPALKDVPEVKELIKKSAGTNVIAGTQLDNVMPKNASSQQIEDLLSYLENIGMEVDTNN